MLTQRRKGAKAQRRRVKSGERREGGMGKGNGKADVLGFVLDFWDVVRRLRKGRSELLVPHPVRLGRVQGNFWVAPFVFAGWGHELRAGSRWLSILPLRKDTRLRDGVSAIGVGLDRGRRIGGEFVDAGRKLLVVLERFVKRDDPPGVCRSAAHV